MIIEAESRICSPQIALQQNTLVSVAEYREKTRDYLTPTEIIEKRLKYIEMVCRNIARQEIEKYEAAS
jgi:hypothetical protein